MSVIQIDRTAEEFRAMARERHERREESFERCDTDGFMSQWAAQEMARRYELAATLAENDGYSDFPALFDLDGNIVPARIVETRYGAKWLVLDRWDGVYEYGAGEAVAWLPLLNFDIDGEPSTRSIKALAKKGYRYGYVQMRAVVMAKGTAVFAAPKLGERYEEAEVIEVL